MALEVEARFRAHDARPLEHLAVVDRLAGATLGASRSFDETDRYLDTDDLRLASVRWACRLRERGDVTIVSLKGPAESATPGWLHRRPEIEGPATPSFDLGEWPPSEARDTLESLSAGQPLSERLQLRQRRTERDVGFGKARIGTLTLDVVRLLARGDDLGTMHIVELELDAANVDGIRHLSRLAEALAGVPGLLAEPRSKLELSLERLARV